MSAQDLNTPETLPELTREPLPIVQHSTDDHVDSHANESHGSRGQEEDFTDKILRDMQKGNTLTALHPYQSTLTMLHVDSCLVLENLCFPPDQAATKAKVSEKAVMMALCPLCSKIGLSRAKTYQFIYRIADSGHLCFGIFTTVYPGDARASLPTFDTAPLVQSGSNRRQVLLAHLIATLTTNFTIQDADMTLTGHKYYGRTIALHSLAVLPELQGLHLGQTLIKSFIHMVKSLGLYDRISLITYEHLICWYELLGFTYHGPSTCVYGGEQWHDMVRNPTLKAHRS